MASHGQSPAAEVQGHLLLTGSWDKQSPARSAGFVGSTGGDGIAAPHFGVGQPLPMRADGATPTACALRVRASSSWRPAMELGGEISSPSGHRRGCCSFPAAGRAVPFPGWWSPPISGPQPRARFCCKNGQNRWMRALRCLVRCAPAIRIDGRLRCWSSALGGAVSTRYATPMHDQFALFDHIFCPGVMGTWCSSDLPPSGGTEGVVPFPIGGPGRHEHVSRCTAAAPTRIPCTQVPHPSTC